MIGRVADTYFAGSEMEDLQLAQKIEYLLDEILPAVGKSRVKQEIIIDEFSESDDDYWFKYNCKGFYFVPLLFRVKLVMIFLLIN